MCTESSRFSPTVSRYQCEGWWLNLRDSLGIVAQPQPKTITHILEIIREVLKCGLEKDVDDQLDRSCEKWRITWSREKNVISYIKWKGRRQTVWFTSWILLARSHYSEGPATGHLDTGFSWFPCVYKRMLRWFPRFKVATTCFLRSPPDLNLLVTNFVCSYTCKITTATGWQPNCS